MLDINEIPKIKPINKALCEKMQRIFDDLIKPVGSLARLEEITCLYAGAHNIVKLVYPKKALVIFASDYKVIHNIKATISKQIEQKEHAINILADFVGSDVSLVDVQTAKDGMTNEDFNNAFVVGKNSAMQAIDNGAEVLGLAYLGEGAPSRQLALIASMLDKPIEDFPIGSLVEDRQVPIEAKKHLVLVEIGADYNLQLAKSITGTEIPALIGAIMYSASRGVPVFLDSIATIIATYLAIGIDATVKEYVIPVCTTKEAGLTELLEKLDMTTIVDLGSTSSCGEGALLGFTLLDAGIKALNEMDAFGRETVHFPLEDLEQHGELV